MAEAFDRNNDIKAEATTEAGAMTEITIEQGNRGDDRNRFRKETVAVKPLMM